MNALEIKHLNREYPRKGKEPLAALSDINLEIPQGEVHGLLGPNGAGKTTLCKILSTVLLPTSGTATICGYDVVTEKKHTRPRIGIVFGGEKGLYQRLTPRQNLNYWASLYRLPRRQIKPRVIELLDRFGLQERADDPVETFSRGMQQRLHLARGLIGNPEVLVLDEPTAGMDPVAASDFRELVMQLKAEGLTILMTTHDMREAEIVCDRVSLIDNGKLIATEQPRTIGKWLTRYEIIEAQDVPDAVVDDLKQMDGVVNIEHRDGAVRIEVDEVCSQVLEILARNGVTRLHSSPPSLEDVYLHLIGDRGLTVR